ncbi:MAG: glycoside hydrolase family 92 protein, partial [Muribaculaceae bacterium]|nr:glycoside hydrolase family 92 protein [Muribaculaceae bacterium]
KFFDKGYFNVNNEPSFLSPCLYHWIDRPDKTGKRVYEIIAANYSDTPNGLPGNDDSGAMSSWLAFHMSGLYPNAGQDYYLIHTPLLKSITFHLANGKDFTVRCDGEPGADAVIERITLNGKPFSGYRLSHKDLMEGGELLLHLRDDCDDAFAAAESAINKGQIKGRAENKQGRKVVKGKELGKVRFVYKLHGQTRRYDVAYRIVPGGLQAEWGIERNGKWQSGIYRMSRKALDNGKALSFLQPVDGDFVELNDNEVWGILPMQLLQAAKRGEEIEFNNTRWSVVNNATTSADGQIRLMDLNEGAEMLILDREDLPLILEMKNNPLEINWTIEMK